MADHVASAPHRSRPPLIGAALLALGFVLALPAADGRSGPGLPTQTWPAGTLLDSDTRGGRICTFHRGWFFAQGEATTTLFDISQGTLRRQQDWNWGANGHRWWKIGDLVQIEYDNLLRTGTSWAYGDMSDMLDLGPYTDAGSAPVLLGTDARYSSISTFPHRYTGWDDKIYDVRSGQHVGTKDLQGMRGVNASLMSRIGNYVFFTPGDGQSGVACFDFSDPGNPRLVDNLTGDFKQYTTTMQFWRNYLVLCSGSDDNGPNDENLVAIDISDPTDLRYAFGFKTDVAPGRYIHFQDEYGFTGRFHRGHKVNMETGEVVLRFDNGGNFWEDFQWLPLGHMLLVSVAQVSDSRSWLYTHQDGLDTRPPTVGHHFPRDGDTDRSLDTVIGLVINETLDDLSLNDQTITVRPLGGTPVSGTVASSQYDVVNFAPDQPLQDDTTYIVELVPGGVKDVAGNGVAGYSFRFSTGPTVDRSGDGGVDQPPSVSLTAPAAGASGQVPATFALAASASDADGSVASVAFYADGALVATDTSAPYAATWTTSDAGSHSLYAVATDDAGNTRQSTAVSVQVTLPPGPWGGSAVVWPGVLEAEHYDVGGEGVAYHDTDAGNNGGAFRADDVDIEATTGGGYNLGWMADGEWLEYAIDASAGTYRLELRVASGSATPGSLALAIDGSAIGTVQVPATGGWQSWQTVALEGVAIAGGSRELRIAVIGSGINLDRVTATLSGDPPPPDPTITITSPADGASVEPPVTVAFTLTDWTIASGGDHYHLFVDGVDQGAQYDPSGVVIAALEPGSHEIALRLAQADHTLLDASDSITVTVPEPPPATGPYLGTPAAVPGTIEAEHYDLGGEGVAYHDTEASNQGGELRSDAVDIEACGDTGGGHNVGWMDDGEWLDYSVSIVAGTYDLELRVAAGATTAGSLALSLDGADLGSVDVQPTGGWQTWESLSLTGVTLPGGEHRLRVTVAGDGINLNRITATAVADPEPVPDTVPVADAIELDGSGPFAVGSPVGFRLVASDADGDALEYRWDLGSGSGAWSTSSELDHTFASPGIVTVTGQVRDEDGNVVAASRRLVVYDAAITAAASTAVASGPLALDPARGRVWVANPDNDSVTAIDARSATPTVLGEFAVDARPSSVAIDARGRVWVACRDAHRVVVLDGGSGARVTDLDLGSGAAPVAIVFDPSDGAVGWIGTAGSAVVQRIEVGSLALGPSVALGAGVHALALSGDGSSLLATRLISGEGSGTIWRVDTASLGVDGVPLPVDSTTEDSSVGGRGLPNYIAGVAMEPLARGAWYVAKKDNILRGLARDGEVPSFETTLRALVGRLGASLEQEATALRLDIDNHGQPSAVAVSPRGSHLLVTMQGNDRLIVLDAATGREEMRLDVGAAPQGVLVDPVTGRIFVKAFLGRSVQVIDGAPAFDRAALEIEQEVSLVTVGTEALPPQILRGKRIFYNARDERMAQDGYISCASCHLDGGHDGRTWDFTDRGEGLRNTTSLRGRRGTGHGFVHWSANFDEIQDFEHDIRSAFGGRGFLTDAEFAAGTRNQPLGDAKAGVDPDLDALAAYVASLDRVEDSPHRASDGGLTAAAVRGREIFRRLDCAECHGGDDFTISAAANLVDVGTIGPDSGQRLGSTLEGIDVPTLRGVWATAPYFHDGSATDLETVLTIGATHDLTTRLTGSERADLVAFLKQIDGDEPAVPRAGVGDDPDAPLVSQLEVASGKAYEWDRLELGVESYIDRSYVFDRVPDDLEGHLFLRTANNDKAHAASPMISFELGAEATVVVAWDSRYPAPSWLGGWALRSDRIGSTDVDRTLYARRFSPGGIHLGPNAAASMYNVVVVPTGDVAPDDPPPVAINFQPPGAPVPAGFLADTGAVLGDRGNGYRYGWDQVNSAYRDRNVVSDQARDTLTHLQRSGDRRWSIELPDGGYRVRILAGDPQYSDQVNSLVVGGTTVSDPDGQDPFDEYEVTVQVTGGRLEIAPAAGASNAKLAFIQIEALGGVSN